MRNLKKILALVLALVMSMSLLATANAFEDSKDIDPDFNEAIQVLSGLGVFQGYDNGKTFQPQGKITRAEVAAIIYRIVTGDTADKQVGIYADYNKFDDVKSASWYAGYVNFCANAEIIKGYSATKFGPNDHVTGYQALAMILRAIGYDKNGEFTGAGWQVQTAAVAKKLNVTKNIIAGTLGLNASREMVAEILFQTIAYAPQVNYTLAFGYSDRNTETLGYETFKLVEVGEVTLDYGRPYKMWTSFGVPCALLAYEPVVTYDAPVDECDVARDMGLTKDATVSQAWLDGADVSKLAYLSGKDNKISLQYTTAGANIIGDQGRQTEIYKLADGTYSIVEINTYFAKVVKVTDARADKNGHLTAATIDLGLYINDDVVAEVKNVPATGYAKGDYVLVTLDRKDDDAAVKANITAVAADIASIELAEPTEMARLNAFSNRACGNQTIVDDIQAKVVGTVTLGENKYTDADKFYLGYPATMADVAVAYNVYFDGMGNVIALLPVNPEASFAVINAIRWNSPAMGTTIGGYVTANLTLADGTVETDVVVAKVNGKAPISQDMGEGKVYAAGRDEASSVSNVYTQNPEYYGHLVNYFVNADGNYELSLLGAEPCSKENIFTVDMTEGVIAKGKSTIYGLLNGKEDEQINVAYASDETVYLYYNGNYGYDVYVGYNNAPSIAKASICYILNDAGRVALAVVKGTVYENNNFEAYLANPNPVSYAYLDGKLYNVYYVYKVGSTEITPVYVDPADAATIAAKGEGFYGVAVTNGVAELTHRYYKGVVGKTYCGYDFDIVKATTAVIANSVATTTKGAPNKNYSNMVEAEYFLIKNNQVTATTYEAIGENSKIAVFYNTTKLVVGEKDQEIYTPDYVYVWADPDPDGDKDDNVEVAGEYTAKFDIQLDAGNVFNSKNVVIVDEEEVPMTVGQSITFVVVTGGQAPSISVDNDAVLMLVGSDTVRGAYTYTVVGLKDCTITIK